MPVTDAYHHPHRSTQIGTKSAGRARAFDVARATYLHHHHNEDDDEQFTCRSSPSLRTTVVGVAGANSTSDKHAN
jgi:hypothetical protein